MAKRRHEESQQESSKAGLIGLSVAGLAVAGLVVWALTRTVQPVPETVAVDAPVGIEQPSSTSTMIPPPAGTLPPVAGNTADTAGTAGYTPAPPAQATSTYTPNPPTEDENATVQRISVQELRAKLDAKQVTIIDVRDQTSYVTSHIPGALHVPMATVESQVSFLPKDKPIVTYCT